jgi:hypothetical protein
MCEKTKGKRGEKKTLYHKYGDDFDVYNMLPAYASCYLNAKFIRYNPNPNPAATREKRRRAVAR